MKEGSFVFFCSVLMIHLAFTLASGKISDTSGSSLVVVCSDGYRCHPLAFFFFNYCYEAP